METDRDKDMPMPRERWPLFAAVSAVSNTMPIAEFHRARLAICVKHLEEAQARLVENR